MGRVAEALRREAAGAGERDGVRRPHPGSAVRFRAGGGGGPITGRRVRWRWGSWLGPGAGEPDGAAPRDRQREAVATAKAFIEERLGDALDVTRISREAKLSRPHFTRVFRELEGMSPWAYVIERRVRRAAELLEGGRPLSEVAADAGFADQSHLTRVFKRVTGTTPGEFRRRRTNVQDDWSIEG